MPAALFDINVWVAAVFATHPAHSVARRSLIEATPVDPALWCRVTQLGFLRLASNPVLLRTYGVEGLTNRDALVAFAAFMELPQVREQPEPAGTVDLWHRLAARRTASPKVWMDAYLAAFAIAGGLRLVSLDRDFLYYARAGLDVAILSP